MWINHLLEDEISRDYLKSCLGDLRSNIKDAQQEVRRVLVTMLALLTLFELLSRSAISEISFGPVKLSDLSWVMKSLPVLFAFMYHSFLAKFTLIALLRGVHGSIIQKILKQPVGVVAEFEQFLFPPSTFSILNVLSSQREEKTGVWTWIIGLFSLFLFLTVLLLPIGADVYMLVKCFIRFGFKDLLVWASLILTAILMIPSIGYVLMGLDSSLTKEFSI